MSTVMHALRAADGFGMLADALEIYINDPVLDWLRHCVSPTPSSAAVAASSSSFSSEPSVHGSIDKDTFLQKSHEGTWEPRRRIENCVRKLMGVHPVVLYIEELKSNINVTKAGTLDALTRIVQGSRMDKSDAIVDVGKQVTILIDLATDPNILARQFVGLMAWL